MNTTHIHDCTAPSYQSLADQPSYDELRAEAALHAKLRAENFQKAAKARGQKQWEVAQFFAQKVLLCVKYNNTCILYNYNLDCVSLFMVCSGTGKHI